MGLTWCLLDRIDEGCEERVEQARAELADLSGAKWRSRLQPRRKRVLEADIERFTSTPFKAARLPRVGIDQDATFWFRGKCEDARKMMAGSVDDLAIEALGSDDLAMFGGTLAEATKRAHGMYVVELCNEPDAIPAWTSATCGPFDFRGGVVADLVGLLPNALIDEAFEDHDADDCIAYARRLQEASADLCVDPNAVEVSRDPIVVGRMSARREPGWLYFLDDDGDVARKRTTIGGEPTGEAEKIEQLAIKRDPRALYTVMRDGSVRMYARLTSTYDAPNAATRENVARAKDIVASATRWLRFWGPRGFSFDARM